MYGYKVLAAQSPGDAIIIYEQHTKPIHLLITDVVMPGMNGKELKNRLDSIKPGLKTIFMSGYTADVVANRGILEKGVHFLQKPFKPVDLVMKVEEVLEIKG
jgi:response regulator RpfG family c-di-GMP phosphodiesterase